MCRNSSRCWAQVEPQGRSVRGSHCREPPPPQPAPSSFGFFLGRCVGRCPVYPAPLILCPFLPWWLSATGVHRRAQAGGEQVDRFPPPSWPPALVGSSGLLLLQAHRWPKCFPSLSSLLLLTAYSSLSSPSVESFWIYCLFPRKQRVVSDNSLK